MSDCQAGQDPDEHYCVPADLEDVGFYRYFTPVFLAVYLLFSAILMLNMLIAVFTAKFDSLHSNSVAVWKWEMYRLLEEFDSKPVLPAPLVVFESVFRLLKMTWKKCCRRNRENRGMLTFYVSIFPLKTDIFCSFRVPEGCQRRAPAL